jgi:uroporphyrinogen decarboxylase
MKRNMDEWKDQVIANPVKQPLPILSFPAVKLMGISVQELISDSKTQAQAMRIISERNISLAAVSMMDLSLEAEAFGAEIRVADDEVPTVIGSLVKTAQDAENLSVPQVGAGRTQIYVDAVRYAVELIQDRPVFAGIIGPFTLAGRLFGLTQILKATKKNPEMVHVVLEKCNRFLIDYIEAYKNVGANGVLMAEPLTGLLSPALAEKFSEPYVKEIVDQVQEPSFMVMYHNCGDNALLMIDSILRVGAKGYHFGNVISMPEAVKKCPRDVLCLGNLDPGIFVYSTRDQIVEKTIQMIEASEAPNYIPSSGCDIPPVAQWDNIDAFYEATSSFYGK